MAFKTILKTALLIFPIFSLKQAFLKKDRNPYEGRKKAFKTTLEAALYLGPSPPLNWWFLPDYFCQSKRAP